jgi:hypothetical protein
MIKIRKLPPGRATGADDLQIWARRRNGGLSGVPEHRNQRSPRDLAHFELLRSLVAAGRKLDSENLRLAVLLLETFIRYRQVRKPTEPLGE